MIWKKLVQATIATSFELTTPIINQYLYNYILLTNIVSLYYFVHFWIMLCLIVSRELYSTFSLLSVYILISYSGCVLGISLYMEFALSSYLPFSPYITTYLSHIYNCITACFFFLSVNFALHLYQHLSSRSPYAVSIIKFPLFNITYLVPIPI